MIGPVTDFGDRPGAALVVGGSGGLGLAVVRLLAARGSDVALTFRSREPAAGCTKFYGRWADHSAGMARVRCKGFSRTPKRRTA